MKLVRGLVYFSIPLAVAGIVFAGFAVPPAATAQVSEKVAVKEKGACDQLASMSLPQAKITAAEAMSADQFTLDAGGGNSVKNLRSFCRVRATLTPSSDSDIKIEVWLPMEGWNGKLQAVGNGGWAGAISYGAMAMALQDGYATVSTDTGHTGANGTFAPGHPEKLVDFAYRSSHEMTVKAKAIVASYYGNLPKYTYWNGCSTGGRQGLVGASRYPDDFDGVIAGDSITPRAIHDAWEFAIMLAVSKNPASAIPENKFEFIHKAVLEACDAKDGVKDGVVGDPERCQFKPETLACKPGAPSAQCLTPEQAKTVQMIFSPLKAKGKVLFPGLPPGTELGWADRLMPPADAKILPPAQSLMFQGFGSDWDWKKFDVETDLPTLEKLDALQSLTSPDLSKFTAHGGKVLMYSGWGSPIDSGYAAIDLYKSIKDKSQNGANSVRLFMIPAMGHCQGGQGATDKFNPMAALSHWVESGVAPKQMTAAMTVPTYARSSAQVGRTRPICAYPQVARYRGTGDVEDAANFECKTP